MLLVIIVATFFASLAGFRDRNLLERYMFSPQAILRGKQRDRMMTSALLHAGWWHLGVNMYCLWVFGGMISSAQGGGWLLFGLYCASILGGSFLALWLHRNDPDYRALGASGGVSGVIFASIFLFPGGEMVLFIPLPVNLPSWLFAIGYVGYSMYGIRSGVGNIGHDAHLGGALSGLLMTVLLYPAAVVAQPTLFVSILVLVVAFIAAQHTLPPGYSFRESIRYAESRWKKFRVKRGRKAAVDEERRMNELLDRISESGIGSLSAREKEDLSRLALRKKEREEAARRSPGSWRRS